MQALYFSILSKQLFLLTKSCLNIESTPKALESLTECTYCVQANAQGLTTASSNGPLDLRIQGVQICKTSNHAHILEMPSVTAILNIKILNVSAF